MYYQDYSLILLFICSDLGYGCPNFCKNGTARGVLLPKIRGAKGCTIHGF